jgi:multidrug efflux system membrane fusion protein
MKSMRKLIAAALVVALGAGLYFHFGGSSPTSKAATGPQGAPVVAADAGRRDVAVNFRTIGSVQPYTTVSVKSRVDGHVIAVAFQEGQIVKKGDLLFTIDPRPFEADLKQAEAALARDKALLERAKLDLTRYTELAKKDFAPKQQLDQAVANAASAAATVKSDEAAVDHARLELAYAAIRSPIQGRTGNILIQLGNVVKANDTVSLVVINQTQPIYVTFAVPERNLPDIKRRMTEGILMVEALPQGDTGAPIRGELTFVNNTVDTTTGTIQMKATFANQPERLTPGQSVNVTLTLANKAQAVVIPSEAVQIGPNGQFVYIVKQDMTVEQRPVVTGVNEGGMTVIESGVEAGEKVVKEGQLRLFPGAKVRLQG